MHLASYCSYCERPISNLAVEHIEPKDGPHGQPQLIGVWTNFLLACTNCNSTKKDKRVVLADIFIPDRDNTFAALKYLADGNVVPAPHLLPPDKARADSTLKLTGLDKAMRRTLDSRGRLISEDRASQRMQVWALAEEGRAAVMGSPGNAVIEDLVVKNALLSGFFSIWLEVFSAHTRMRQKFIDAFSGTAASGCFDAATSPVSPCPNHDGLPFGGKI